jgi:hypothetical protein
MDRRALLANLGAVGTVAIAGCSDGSESDTPEAATSSGSETPGEDSQTAQETERATPEEGTGADSPKDAATKLSTAIQDGNVSTANDFLHPASPRYPIETASDESLVFTSVQQISSQELIDRVQRNSNETTEQLQDAIQDLEDRFSEYEDYAILSIESEIAGTTVQRISFAVQDNGNWYYWPEE